MSAPAMKWHFGTQVMSGAPLVAACGRVPSFANKTTDPAEVTCLWCKRKPAYLGAPGVYKETQP